MNNVLHILTVVFVVLKMVGVITWPWLVVLIPLWISLTFIVLAIILIMVLFIVNKLL